MSGSQSVQVVHFTSAFYIVARLQGQPQSKSPRDILGEEDWRYPGGTVKFHSTSGKVIYWENRDGSLKAKGIRPDVNTYDFNRGRKARLDAWTRRGELAVCCDS